MKINHPGDMIRTLLAGQGLNLSEAAEKTGITKATLSRLINCKQCLTPEVALKISILCRVSPLTLLTCQNHYDLHQLGWKG